MNTMTASADLDQPLTLTASADLDQPLTLTDDERQPCEVWTRVMGYHRPVSSFNIGKKGEHAERRFFNEDASPS